MAAERQRLLQYACYRLGSRDGAEDVVQDALLSLWQKQRDGVSVLNTTAYLYRSVANLSISRLRESAHMRLVPIEARLDTPDDTEDIEQELRQVSYLLSTIPDAQAEVIRLRYYGDKSFKEIAEILDIPITTAKSRFVYGLEKIRQGMRDLSKQ
jgi:RNA polymerase sigma-70 factor (ECF subfamily)